MDILETQSALSPSDLKKLQQNIIGGSIFGVFALIIFGFMFGMVMSSRDHIAYFVFGGFGLFFFGIVAYIIAGPILDIRSGQKTIIRGVLTNKERHKSSSSGRKKSKSSPKYYFYFGEKKYYVSAIHFAQASVGDDIALHYAPKSKTSLSIENFSVNDLDPSAVNSAPSLSIFEKYKQERAAVEKKEYPLDSTDLQKLRTTRNKKLAVNIFLLGFFSLFAIVFSAGIAVDWVFAIPEAIFLIVIYITFKWCIACITKYRKDKKSGIKVVALCRVKDKITHSGSGKSFSISTDFGTFPVSPAEYEQIKTGDQIFSFHGKYSGWLIGIKIK